MEVSAAQAFGRCLVHKDGSPRRRSGSWSAPCLPDAAPAPMPSPAKHTGRSRRASTASSPLPAGFHALPRRIVAESVNDCAKRVASSVPDSSLWCLGFCRRRRRRPPAPPVPHDTDVLRRLPHVRQSHAWDCGLACVEMVLRLYGAGRGCSVDTLAAAVGTRSTWTIDLAYLLHSFGVPLSLSTVTLGVNDSYRALEFYNDDLGDDARRVKALFTKAPSVGVSVVQGGMPLDKLRSDLSAGAAVFVVLVDLRYLRCNLCFMKRPLLCFTYTGHFIVVCGYDKATDTFVYRDPASRKPHCVINAADLEVARKAYGTDEDVLRIPVQKTL